MSVEENLNKYDYLKEICKFSELRNEDIRKMIKGVSSDEKKLWAMFARKKRDLDNYNSDMTQICIQVGSSKNIYSELRGILRCMISEPKKEKVSTEFSVEGYIKKVSNTDLFMKNSKILLFMKLLLKNI